MAEAAALVLVMPRTMTSRYNVYRSIDEQTLFPLYYTYGRKERRLGKDGSVFKKMSCGHSVASNRDKKYAASVADS